MKKNCKKHNFEIETFRLVRVRINFLQRVRFRIEYFRTCQILHVLLLQKLAKFSCVHQNRARFVNVLMYDMGSVNQVILLGQALFTPTLINVTRRIKTTNLIRFSTSKYVDKECFLLFKKVLLKTMSFETYRDKQCDFNDSFMMTSCPMIRQRTDLIKF